MEQLEPQRPEAELGWQGQERKGCRTQGNQGPAKLRRIGSILCCWCITWSIRAQGFGIEAGTQGSHIPEFIDCTSAATVFYERGRGKYLEGGPTDPKFEEETGTAFRAPSQRTGEEGRAVGDLQVGGQRTCGKGESPLRKRQPGTHKSHPRDPDATGSGHEWNGTTHHGAAGRESRNRGRGSFHGRREGQGDKAGEDQPHGRGNQAGTGGTAYASTAIVDITGADDLHGQHDGATGGIVTYQADYDRCITVTEYHTQRHDQEETGYRALCQKPHPCRAICNTGEDQGEQGALQGESRRIGRLWASPLIAELEEMVPHTMGYGEQPTRCEDKCEKGDTGSHRWTDDGCNYDRTTSWTSTSTWSGLAMQFHSFTILAEPIQPQSGHTKPGHYLRQHEGTDDCEKGDQDWKNFEDGSPEAIYTMGLLQKHVAITILTAAKAWDEDFVQTMQDRRAAQLLLEVPRNHQDWAWARRQAQIPSPRQAPRLQVYRSTSPIFHDPAWHRFYLAHDTQPIDLVRRVQATWWDLTITDGRYIPWNLHLVDRMVQTSNVIPNDYHTYILTADDETTQTTHETIVLLEIQRKENTDQQVISTADARTMTRMQTKPTALAEIGLLRQCAITYSCTMWRNGNTMRSEPVAWEIADYIVIFMAKQRVIPMPTGDPDRLDQTFFETLQEQSEPEETAEQTESEPAIQSSPESPHPTPPDVRHTVVIRRPRIAHHTDLRHVYAGAYDKIAISAVARTIWTDLNTPQPRIYEIHPIFYADFPFDRTIYWVIAVDETEFNQRPTLRAVLVHLRRDTQRDIQSVALATSTSEYGLLSWARALIQCKRANTHKCAVSQNGRLVQGAQRVTLQHGDYVRIEIQAKNLPATPAELIPVGDGTEATSTQTAFWPPKPNAKESLAPTGQTEGGRTESDTKRTKVRKVAQRDILPYGEHARNADPLPMTKTSGEIRRQDALHEWYWIMATAYIWFAVPLLMRHQLRGERKSIRPRWRRRRTGSTPSKAVFLLILILGQHCRTGFSLQTHHLNPEARQRHAHAHEPPDHRALAQEPGGIGPTQGLPPPGNTNNTLCLTDQGKYMCHMIVSYLEGQQFAANIRQRLLRVPRPLVHSAIVHSKPTPISLVRCLDIQDSTEDALTPEQSRPQVPTADTKANDQNVNSTGVVRDAPNRHLGDSFKMLVGPDILDEKGLCNPWEMEHPADLDSFIEDIPVYYPEKLIHPKPETYRNSHYIHIYTDGSAKWQQEEATSAWAVIIMGSREAEPQDRELHLIDWLAGPTQEDPLHHQWIGSESASSRTAEGEAIAWALLWAIQQGIDRPLHLHSDAITVLHGATGQWSFGTDDQLLRRVRALYQLLWTLIGDTQMKASHIKAHAGHAGNELADLLAKTVRDQPQHARIPDTQLGLWMHGEPPLIEWAWAMIDPTHRGDEVPNFYQEQLHWTHWKPPQNDLDWLPNMPTIPDKTTPTLDFSLNLATYNVSTLKEPAAAAFLRSQLQYFHLHVVGLQETRTHENDIPDSDFYRFIAVSDHGVGGCELWVNRQLHYGQEGDHKQFFERKDFQVVHATAQVLIVNADMTNIPITFCVAHAPHYGGQAQRADTWWKELHVLLDKFAHGRHLILLMDANLPLAEEPPCSGPLYADASAAGNRLHRCLRRYELMAPSTYEELHSGESTTWRSNDGSHEKRIDYIIVPQQWAHTKMKSYVHQHLHSGAGGRDHQAVCLEITGLFGPRIPKTKKPRYDRQQIQHATPDQWQTFFQNWPSVSWEVDPTTHATILEKEIHSRLETLFPAAKEKRRNTLQFSEQTWDHYAKRNKLRKILSGIHRATYMLTLDRAMHTWTSSTPMPKMNAREVIYALKMIHMLTAYQQTHIQLKSNIQRDRSRHLQDLHEPVLQAHKSNILKTLKPFRIEKRTRDLGRRPLPMVEMEDGSMAQTPTEAMARWRRHYAAMEGGHEVDHRQLLQPDHQQPQHLPVTLQEIPTLSELERQMRAAKPGKSMGMDLIPSELLHHQAHRMAYQVWPLYLKQVLTVSECLQHKGGRLISAFKRRGSIQKCENHRALLVSSALGKAFHGTFRRRTVPYVQQSAGPLQLTSQSRPSVSMAAHAVRAHLHSAKRMHHSAFALFLDITHAFYRVLRQFAIGATCTDEHVMEFLRRMGVEEYCIEDIERMMEHGPALSQEKCPAFLHAQVTEIHRDTWFILNNDDRMILTEKGTRPGDGFADILWSLVFAQWVGGLEKKLQATHAFPPRLWNQEHGLLSGVGNTPVPHALIVWADDVVILGSDPSATSIVDKLQHTCSIMVQELLRYGLHPNFKEGKTEAVVDPRGSQATKVRRMIFQDWKGKLKLDTPMPEQPTLKLVPHYKHLGGIITHGCRMQPEIKHRIAQGHAAFAGYRTKVFKPRDVPLPARMTVLRATCLSTMQYNAGTWTGLTQQSKNAWHTGHMNLYRKALTGLRPYQEIRHMTDDEILFYVEELHPEETLIILRLRWYGSALTRLSDHFWAILAYEGTWLQQLREDFQWLYGQIKGFTSMMDPDSDIMPWNLLILQRYTKWQGLLKRATTHAILQRKVHTRVAQYHRRVLGLLHEFGEDIPMETLQNLDNAYHCFGCDKDFRTLASWSVHAFKVHGRVNKWRRLQTGQTCKACARHFPSANRLLRHLQFSPQCADTVASLQLWVTAQPGYGSKVVQEEEKQLLLETWRPTTNDTEPMRHGWTMTEQLRSFLQWCTTRDWLHPDIMEHTIQQVRLHAIYDEEIKEVEEALQLDIQDPDQLQGMATVLQDIRQQSRPPSSTITRKSTQQECLQTLLRNKGTPNVRIKRIPTVFRYILHLYSGVRRDNDIHTVINNTTAPDNTVLLVASLDLVLSRQYGDLQNHTTQEYWLSAAKEGAIFAFVAGPPCESWSISRWHEDEGYSGPKPVRDGNEPNRLIWALAVLRLRDLRQLDVANELLLYTCLLYVAQQWTGGCAILEHPQLPEPRDQQQPASIWLLPLLRYIQKCPQTHAINIKQGFWGAESPKPTRLLISIPGTTAQEIHQWLDEERTTRTLPKPIQMGKTGAGPYRTAALKRYPPGLCRGIGNVLTKATKKVHHETALQDRYSDVFYMLEDVYKQSKFNAPDGADYAK